MSHRPATIGTMSFEMTAAEYVYREGSSDKFYRLYRAGSMFATQYGRAGTYGTFGTKVLADDAAAIKAFDAETKKRHSKGYVLSKSIVVVTDTAPTESWLDELMTRTPAGTVGDGTTTDAPAAQVDLGCDLGDPEVFNRVVAACRPIGVTGVLKGAHTSQPVYPMLAETVTAADTARLLDSDVWVMQPKFDGDRFVVEVVDGEVRVYGRNGQPKTRDVNRTILAPFRHLIRGRWVFDGEMLGGRKLVLFDMAPSDGVLDSGATFATRYAMLEAVAAVLFDGDDVMVSPVARSATEKREMLSDAETNRREGVMFRDLHGSYRAGRSDELLKHKFVKEADCVVLEVGRGGKDNIVVGLRAEDGSMVEVGQVTAIGKGSFVVGDVVEVRYLYVVDPASPRLYQPRIVRRRTDKAPAECVLAQLAGAHTDKAI